MSAKLEILALCNFADFSQNGAFNIVNIIDRITSKGLPTSYSRAFVAFTITGNKPNTKIKAFVLIKDPDAELIVNQEVEMTVGKNGKSNFAFQIVGLELQKYGKYSIEISMDEKNLGNTVFYVTKEEENEK